MYMEAMLIILAAFAVVCPLYCLFLLAEGDMREWCSCLLYSLKKVSEHMTMRAELSDWSVGLPAVSDASTTYVRGPPVFNTAAEVIFCCVLGNSGQSFDSS